MAQRALITGITGQDGSYMADLLLEKGYEVYGLVRKSANFNPWRIAHILKDERVTLLDGDMSDAGSLMRAVKESRPDEVYNFAAQSFVPTSFRNKTMTMETNAVGVARLLDALEDFAPDARFLQAATSEIFGQAEEMPQTERTRPHPRSPYGISKLAGYWFTVNARESRKAFACNSIAFNHESERRGEEFVTRKVTLSVARIKLGLQTSIELGNLDAVRDWGYAPEYVDAMWRMLQQAEPDDYVLATGRHHSVRDLCRVAFAAGGMPDWEPYVVVRKENLRPADVQTLLGDAFKARYNLGWEPRVTFEEMIKRMVESDLRRVEK